MVRSLTFFLVLLCAGPVLGDYTGNTPPPPRIKGDQHLLFNGASDGREGGEDIATAIPIDSFPFADTGATCDNLDDYDEACPFGGSTSPDVVYSLVPSYDMFLDVDLCWSDYDTKVYLYDAGLDLIACNDDYYVDPPCGEFTSFLWAVPVLADSTYYIVVDGFGGDCGNYEIEIDQFFPSFVFCPECVPTEGEPSLVTDYVDEYNGGCLSSPQVFQELEVQGEMCASLCGVSGWYLVDGLSYRDTDWFKVTAADVQIDFTVRAEFPVDMYVLLPDCADLQIVEQASAPAGVPTTISFPTGLDEVYWLWVGPQVFSGPVNEFDYLLEVCGVADGVLDPADLQISSQAHSVWPDRAFPGEAVDFSSFTAANSGFRAALDFTCGYYFSADSTITVADDVFLAADPVSCIAARTDTTLSGAEVVIPPGTSPGSYWIGVLLDDGEVVAESDSTNNFASTTVEVLYPDWNDFASGAAADTASGCGVAWADYDGDGDLDLYLSNQSANKLLRNEGDGLFSDATSSPLDDAGPGTGVAWADFDNDDDPDLYLANDGLSNKLFRNDGGGMFLDITSGPLGYGGATHAVAWGDFDEDGWVDLYLANHGQANLVLRNRRNGTFSDVTSPAAADTGYASSVAMADFDGDSDLDIFVTNYDGDNVLLACEEGLVFSNVTSGPLLGTGKGNAAAWGDYDNDCDLDLYVANYGVANQLLRNDGGGLFTEVTSGPLADAGNGCGVAWADYDNDGDLDLYLANADSTNRLFRNEGGDLFTDATTIVLEGDLSSRGLAWADYDDDGDLDLYVACAAGPNQLFRNELSGGNHWLQVDLVGKATNASAIGAWAFLHAGGTVQMREITSGSGFASQNSLTAEFGLGATTVVDSIVVYWTRSNLNIWYDIAADQRLPLVENWPDAVPTTAGLPAVFALHPNVPNPFNPVTTIGYDLPAPARVDLRIFDLAGRLVQVLRQGVNEAAGRRQAVWDGRDRFGRPAAAGVYFYRLEAGEFDQTRRMLLIK